MTAAGRRGFDCPMLLIIRASGAFLHFKCCCPFVSSGLLPCSVRIKSPSRHRQGYYLCDPFMGMDIKMRDWVKAWQIPRRDGSSSGNLTFSRDSWDMKPLLPQGALHGTYDLILDLDVAALGSVSSNWRPIRPRF